MPLNVLVSPGCSRVADDYIDRELKPGDVFLDTGSLFRAITGTDAIRPTSNPAALKIAAGLRTVAIRFAREANLDGLVRTGNASRANITRLQTEAGGSVKVLQMDREVACRKIRALVPGEDRAAACEEGLSRFFDRLVVEPSDELVR